MSLPFLKTPPPNVVLLPDTQFFTRAIPVPDVKTAAEALAQAELALEALAPFPLAQMYYGCHWLPGAKNALAYAAYRKRFSVTNVETWAAADGVLPAFVTIINPTARPATTAILHTPTTITAVHWSDTSGVPSLVIARAMPQAPADAPPISEADMTAARAALRTELLRATPGTTHLYEYELPELSSVPAPARHDSSLTFTTPTFQNAGTSGNASTAPQSVTFTSEQLDALDVRDKAEITARRAGRRRDGILWRCFVGCMALLALCAVFEIALLGGRFYQKRRVEMTEKQSPLVAEIERANTLASRIEDLSTKRLLPLEMIDLLRPKLPQSVLFTRVSTRSINGIDIQAKTPVASDFNAFRNALASQPNIEKVDVVNSSIRDGSTTFSLSITFKPGSVKPAFDEPPPKPLASPQATGATANAAVTYPRDGDANTPTHEEVMVSGAPPPGSVMVPTVAPSIHDQIRQQTNTPASGEETGTAAPAVESQPTEAPPPNAPPPPNSASYNIKPGDTGTRIASLTGISFRELRAANPGVDFNKLAVGQEINVPLKPSSSTEEHN